MPKIKIAIYSGEIPSTSFVENLITGMAERDYEIFLFGKKKRKVKYNNNIHISYFPESIGAIVLCFAIHFLKFLFSRPIVLQKVLLANTRNGSARLGVRLSRCCKYFIVLNNKPDVFHVQWIKNGSEWLFLKEFGVKVVGSFRGAHVNYSPVADEGLANEYRSTFPHYDAFHSVSTALIKEAEKYNADPSKVYRIPGAVHPFMLKDANSKPPNAILSLLSIGRSHWKKGYHYSLDTCKMLKDSGVKFQYAIVGAMCSEEIIYQIHDLGLDEEINLIDNVPYSRVVDYYLQSDLFLLPSVEEGIANVVLEAMAIGVPVVSTDCGGMKEVIVHGKNGWIAPVRQPQVMADIIMDIVKGEYDLNSIRQAAKETIREKHLIPEQLDAFEKMYHSIVLKN